MKARDIKNMSREDMWAKLDEMKKELIKINTQISTGASPESPGKAKQIKKTIARILTKLNQAPTGGKTKA